MTLLIIVPPAAVKRADDGCNLPHKVETTRFPGGCRSQRGRCTGGASLCEAGATLITANVGGGGGF